jgi:hypothetical protein
MFGLETLDVLIGLVTVYLVFGLSLTVIVEAFTTWFALRSSNLEAPLKEFLAGELRPGVPFIKAFYDHGWTKWPSGINEWLAKVAGLLVGTFTVSLSAPFWFDVPAALHAGARDRYQRRRQVERTPLQ